MSISFRLNLLIVAVSALGLGLLVAAMVLNAGPRIHAENDSTMRLAKEFVETTIESLQGTSDPAARLKVLLEGLKGVRHVRIFLYGEDTPEAADGDAGADAKHGGSGGGAFAVATGANGAFYYAQ